MREARGDRKMAEWTSGNSAAVVTIAGIAGVAELRAIPGKVETVFRPELRKNKDLERSTDFEARGDLLGAEIPPTSKRPVRPGLRNRAGDASARVPSSDSGPAPTTASIRKPPAIAKFFWKWII